MQSFVAATSASSIIGAEGSRGNPRLTDFGELERSTGFYQDDVVDLTPGTIFSFKSGSVAVVNNSQFGGLNTNFSSSDVSTSGTGAGTGQNSFQKGAMPVAAASFGAGNFENWGDSAVAGTSQQTDTSTDIDTDDRKELKYVQQGALVSVDSMDRSHLKTRDQKALRRLAQNREAARKSRLRKKAYVQQLENSWVKLTQLEQELQRAHQQGIFVGNGHSADQTHMVGGNGALAFDMEYARWLDEHQRHINELRAAVNSYVGDNELCLLVDSVMAHYEEIFRLKSVGAKSDVFHMLSGMWRTPAERCFMWLGGFRSSELLKILGSHLEPLTDQQLMGICNLQQSCQQAEDALSQGMEALQQSLAETLSSGSLAPSGNGNVADYMGQMALAMGKLGTLENFLHQADLLRQQTLQQMYRILTTRQAARALLAINDYLSRLRALSSLWLARPKD
ncbi:transcription factor TGA2.3-like isoform X2 [Macadamia integrifolia]|uniref:transcription factor TGA2.3-like isoform X2 n=1 Tax=Macadamia integrifolia TaxID=60698 RepID=UPI001C4F3057|nr:transcription factor TGA2.3-like isoform X2 [Macadamia integrifolia]